MRFIFSLKKFQNQRFFLDELHELKQIINDATKIITHPLDNVEFNEEEFHIIRI